MPTAGLPRAQAQISDQRGYPTREWYAFFSRLLNESTDAGLSAQIQSILDRLKQLESGSIADLSIIGENSVSVVGMPSSGRVTITLDGDAATPAATWYYGTGQDGVRGWYQLSDGFSVTSDLTKDVDALTGVTTFGLSDLSDTGTGDALVKITRDAKGRVEGTEAATTDDLPEGPSNLYYTDQRVQVAVGEILDATASVVATYSPGSISIQLSGDVPTPVAAMFYATDGLGVKGWIPQPPVELNSINGYGHDGGYIRSNGAEWVRVSSIPKADVGLGEVDNTSDASKPVSAAQAAAIAEAETETGVYTPTVTNVLNVTSSSANPVTYMRKGSVVFLSGSVGIEPTTAGLDTRARISIPIPSDFTNGEQANGVCTIQYDTGTGNLTSNPSFDNIVVQILPASSGELRRVFFFGSYEIL